MLAEGQNILQSRSQENGSLCLDVGVSIEVQRERTTGVYIT